MGHRPSREELRNTALSIVLGLVLAVLFVTATSRAHLARASAAELPPELRVPVRMNPEPDVPGWAPPAFAEPNEIRPRTTLASWQEQRIVARAREELERVTTYDNSYMEISGYPMGDVPSDRGACTDVVVRSLRAINIDLQPLVHEAVEREPEAYGRTTADARIDHRRVGTMFLFFEKHAMALSLDPKRASEFRAGDVVFYTRTTGNAEHVAVVSDRIGPRGLPMLIQNGGPKPVENDTLDRGKMVGHFRVLPRR